MADKPLEGTENLQTTPEPEVAPVPAPQGIGPADARPTTKRPKFKYRNYNQDSGGMTTESGRFVSR